MIGFGGEIFKEVPSENNIVESLIQYGRRPCKKRKSGQIGTEGQSKLREKRSLQVKARGFKINQPWGQPDHGLLASRIVRESISVKPADQLYLVMADPEKLTHISWPRGGNGSLLLLVSGASASLPIPSVSPIRLMHGPFIATPHV